jgi:hypothetical protein
VTGAPALTDFDWRVRGTVYSLLAQTTEAPSSATLAEALSCTVAEVQASLRALQSNHHIGLFPDRDEAWIVNPFSAVPTEYPVETERGRFWAACAWDALGVPAMLGMDGWTETRCAGSGTPLSFGVKDGVLRGDDGFIHLVVPLRDAWHDIGFT